jgi:hypothetical protein
LVYLVKQTKIFLLIAVFTLLFILPLASPFSMVAAQTGGYSIEQVDHKVQVMYTGHVVILDTIHVSGRISDGFMIGLPYQYSADVLKVLAYDDNHVYNVNLGVQLGDRSGFYGVEINFDGNSPRVFTVAFVLSNSLITENGSGNYTLEFPAYPSLTQNIGSCNVNIALPSSPTSITISKTDGAVTSTTYAKNNLPAYTYTVAAANIRVSSGTFQLATINSLNRQITIESTGTVTALDTYRITSNSPSSLNSFVLSLPSDAANVAVRDQFGGTLSTRLTETSNVLLANSTFVSFVNQGQSTVITAQYNLPGAVLQGADYVLADFNLFPDFQYLVEQATIIFNLPEGATLVTPQASSLDASSTLTRSTYQDTLTVTADDVSYVDYLAPRQNTLQLSYNYNPVWVSFRPTFWASFAAVIGCIGAVVYRKRRPKEETYQTRAEELSTPEPVAPQRPVYEVKPGQHVTPDDIRNFVDAYEDKKQLNAELKSLDVKAQKGKIPRRQYKVQRRAIEIRIESLTRNIERTKAVFRGSSGTYPDLIRQLDLAEDDLAGAEENIRRLEFRQSRGAVSLETYKRNISEYQRVRDKAESAINGILLRLREKIR